MTLLREPHEAARVLRHQLGDICAEEGRKRLGAAVRGALPSSRLDRDGGGKTLVLRYGPSKLDDRDYVEHNLTWLAEMLATVTDELMAIRTEFTGWD